MGAGLDAVDFGRRSLVRVGGRSVVAAAAAAAIGVAKAAAGAAWCACVGRVESYAVYIG